MTDTLKPREAYLAISQWVNDVQDFENAPANLDMSALLYEIKKPGRYQGIRSPHEAVHQDAGTERQVLGFVVTGGPKVGERTRYLLPIHFAMLRAFEMVPRISVPLVNSGSEHRLGDDRILRVALRIAPTVAARLEISQWTFINRVGFNVPSDAAPFERRTKDYHYILPSGFVLIRHRTQGMHTQETWLHAVQKLLMEYPAEAPASVQEMTTLFRKLFALADRWHWDELLDRLDSDPRAVWP